MAKILDDGVGNVTQALKDAGIFDTTVRVGPIRKHLGCAPNLAKHRIEFLDLDRTRVIIVKSIATFAVRFRIRYP